MAKIVDIMRIQEEAEPRFIEKKEKKEEKKESEKVDESIIDADECSKYKGGEFSKYEKGLKSKIAKIDSADSKDVQSDQFQSIVQSFNFILYPLDVVKSFTTNVPEPLLERETHQLAPPHPETRYPSFRVPRINRGLNLPRYSEKLTGELFFETLDF